MSFPSLYHSQKNNYVDIKGTAKSSRDRTVQESDFPDHACVSTPDLAFREVYGKTRPQMQNEISQKKYLTWHFPHWVFCDTSVYLDLTGLLRKLGPK